MAWVRVESSVARHRKFHQAGPGASWLWVCGLAYCQEGLTDGFIPREALQYLGVPLAGRYVQRLVAAGLWHVVDGGWCVHDYLSYNHEAAEIRRVQGVRRQAGRTGGRPAAGAARRPGDPPVSDQVHDGFRSSSDRVQIEFRSSSDQVHAPLSTRSDHVHDEFRSGSDHVHDEFKSRDRTKHSENAGTGKQVALATQKQKAQSAKANAKQTVNPSTSTSTATSTERTAPGSAVGDSPPVDNLWKTGDKRRMAKAPAEDGNYRVIARVARELLQQHGPLAESDLVELAKTTCAERGIAYGPPAVAHDVVHRACASELFKFRHPELAGRAAT